MSGPNSSGRGGCYQHIDSERCIHCDRCLACLGERPRWWRRAVFSGGRHFCAECAEKQELLKQQELKAHNENKPAKVEQPGNVSPEQKAAMMKAMQGQGGN